MRQAAVGFQCPSCVNEGAKTTRAGRTAYGGKRSANPALTSQVLIALNAAVFVLILATGSRASEWLYQLALLPTSVLVPLDGGTRLVTGVADGAYWQLVTNMFLHEQVWHIGFNMVALWFLGPQLESALGRSRFLSVYFLSGLTASAFVYWLSATNGITYGASGAVYGLMGALMVIAFKIHGSIAPLFPWIAINFVITLTIPGISWQGHLGGFVGGLLIAALFVYAPRSRRSAWQISGAAVFAVLLAVAILARTATLS
jgi:membrane associated rhomboid family serine protease